MLSTHIASQSVIVAFMIVFVAKRDLTLRVGDCNVILIPDKQRRTLQISAIALNWEKNLLYAWKRQVFLKLTQAGSA
jgi:hypothetical protein